jgi:hypothetical protein
VKHQPNVDAVTGQDVHVIEIGDGVNAVAWSPDGSQPVYGGDPTVSTGILDLPRRY